MYIHAAAKISPTAALRGRDLAEGVRCLRFFYKKSQKHEKNDASFFARNCLNASINDVYTHTAAEVSPKA